MPDYSREQVRSIPSKNVLNGERLTDESVRVVAFARFVLAERGGSVIGVEQLLLGILNSQPDMFGRLVSAEKTVERLKESVELVVPLGPAIPDETEASLSTSASQAVRRAIAEADALGSLPVTPAHLLLGLLSDNSTPLAARLLEAGVTREAVLKDIQGGRRGQ